MPNSTSRLAAKPVKAPRDLGKVLHTVQNIALPIIVATLVYYDLVPFAILFVFLGKWRVFAVQPRHWVANIRTNMPDLVVGLSFLTFMVKASTNYGLILATIGYIVWLVFIKPASSTLMIGAQAMITQLLGLMALFWYADSLSETVLVVLSWIIALVSARHFLSAFEEPLSRVIAMSWALFVAQLTWLLNRWLIVYGVHRNIVVPQIVLIVGTVAFVVGSLYYLYKKDSLRKKYMRQYVIYGSAIILLVILFSDWSAEL